MKNGARNKTSKILPLENRPNIQAFLYKKEFCKNRFQKPKTLRKR